MSISNTKAVAAGFAILFFITLLLIAIVLLLVPSWLEHLQQRLKQQAAKLRFLEQEDALRRARAAENAANDH